MWYYDLSQDPYEENAIINVWCIWMLEYCRMYCRMAVHILFSLDNDLDNRILFTYDWFTQSIALPFT